MYLIIGKVDGNIECRSAEEKNISRYLVFDSADKNKEVLEKYTELCDRIKNEMEIMNGGKKVNVAKIS